MTYHNLSNPRTPGEKVIEYFIDYTGDNNLFFIYDSLDLFYDNGEFDNSALNEAGQILHDILYNGHEYD